MSAYRIFDQTVVTREGRTEIVRSHGCDGKRHVDSIDMLVYGDDEEVSSASEMGFEDMGPCDGSCDSTNLGGFRFEMTEDVLRKDSVEPPADEQPKHRIKVIKPGKSIAERVRDINDIDPH